MHTCWRKPEDELEMFSPSNGAFIQFKSERDISLSTTCFESVQIVVVVKQKHGNQEAFDEKLLINTTMKTMVTATGLSKPFDRNALQTYEKDMTFILAVSAEDKPCLRINVFPAKSPAREYSLRFDEEKNTFSIPAELLAEPAHDDTVYSKVVESQHNFHRNTNQQLVRNYGVSSPRIGSITTTSQSSVRRFDNCFECHKFINSLKDHVPTCSGKNWFISKMASVYGKNPITRCVIEFESPIMIYDNGIIYKVLPGMKYFSSMADTYFKFESSTKVALLTTGFTRIRWPFVVIDKINSMTTYVEKLVLMTSQDRTIVAAHSSRQMDGANMVTDFEHNTPLVFIMSGKENTTLTVNVYSDGSNLDVHSVTYRVQDKKFAFPPALDVKSSTFVPKPFDANCTAKKTKYSIR